MAQTNDFDTLNSVYKETYADKIKNIIPEGVKLYEMIDFISAEKRTGEIYVQPVSLTLEHGFTYGGNGGQAFALRGGQASQHPSAEIRGHEMVLRSYLSIGAVSRSQNNAAAFVQASKLIVENMIKSFARRLEVQMFYGQAAGGIGTVESITGSVISIDDHEWAAGIWSGAETMAVEVRSSAGALRGEATVSSVSFDNKTVTVDQVPVGTVATDVLYYAGAFGKEFAGLHKIITNTGTLFNIDSSQYNLWKGNVYDVGTGASLANADILAFADIEKGIARAMEKGLMDEDVVLICNPKTWSNLLTEQAGKREYDSSYNTNKLENGAKALTFHAQNGMIEVHSSIYCKEGYAYLLPLSCYMRIGSSDVSLDHPGAVMTGQYIKLVENANAYEMRAYCDQALFCSQPGTSVLFRYIKSEA